MNTVKHGGAVLAIVGVAWLGGCAGAGEYGSEPYDVVEAELRAAEAELSTASLKQPATGTLSAPTRPPPPPETPGQLASAEPDFQALCGETFCCESGGGWVRCGCKNTGCNLAAPCAGAGGVMHDDDTCCFPSNAQSSATSVRKLQSIEPAGKGRKSPAKFVSAKPGDEGGEPPIRCDEGERLVEFEQPIYDEESGLFVVGHETVYFCIPENTQPAG